MKLNPDSHFLDPSDNRLMIRLMDRAMTIEELAEATGYRADAIESSVAFLVASGIVVMTGRDLRSHSDIYCLTDHGAELTQNIIDVKDRAKRLLEHFRSQETENGRQGYLTELDQRMRRQGVCKMPDDTKHLDAAFLWNCGIRVDDDLL